MRSPSLDNLRKTFNLSKTDAQLIKELCDLADDDLALASLIRIHCPSTRKYANSCHHDPYDSAGWRRTLIMHAIDNILGTHGVEKLGSGDSPPYTPPYLYCNSGESYYTTLLYKTETDTLFIGSWGDLVERGVVD